MRMEDIEKSLPVKQNVKYLPEKDLWIVETVITSFYKQKFFDVVKTNAEKPKEDKKE